MALTTPTVTGYSPFWANILVPSQGPGTYSMNSGRASMPYHTARLFNKRSMADARGALAVLIGAVAGTTADVHWSREQGPPGPSASTPQATGVGELGGNRPIEVAYSINRASTAADITELKKWFAQNLLESGITYPTVTGNKVASGLQVGGTGRF